MLSVLANGMAAGCAYGLLAVSFSILVQLGRFLNFAHGAAILAGPYLLLFLLRIFPDWWVLSSVLAVALTGVAGATVEATVFDGMRRKGTSAMSMCIASLGMLIVAESVVSLCFGPQVVPLRRGVITEGISIGAVRLGRTQIYPMIAFAVQGVGLWLFLRFTKPGLIFRALADDRDLALATGLPVRRLTIFACGVCAGLGALAGILVGMDTDVSPRFGFTSLLIAAVAAILGGIGSIPGAMMGGVVLGLAEHMTAYAFDPKWQYPMTFGLLILCLILRPGGLLGSSGWREE